MPLKLLENVHTIAVVGISDKPTKAGYYVPAYLAEQGYRILGVSPVLAEAFGHKVSATLQEVGERIDLVLLFRRSEDVPGHLDDLLAVHPRIVWMQSGIRNQAVAERLRSAGVEVVQDRCLMVDHQCARD